MRAVVIAIRDKKAAIALEGGELRYVDNAQYEIGQVIDVAEEKPAKKSKISVFKVSWMSYMAAAAAAVLIVIGTATVNAAPVSYVTISVKPSITYGVNVFDRVVSATAENDDGQKVLDGLGRDVTKLKLPEAFEVTLNTMKDMDYILEGDVDVTADVTVTNSLFGKRNEAIKQELGQAAETWNASQGEVSVSLKESSKEESSTTTPSPENNYEKDNTGKNSDVHEKAEDSSLNSADTEADQGGENSKGEDENNSDAGDGTSPNTRKKDDENGVDESSCESIEKEKGGTAGTGTTEAGGEAKEQSPAPSEDVNSSGEPAAETQPVVQPVTQPETQPVVQPETPAPVSEGEQTQEVSVPESGAEASTPGQAENPPAAPVHEEPKEDSENDESPSLNGDTEDVAAPGEDPSLDGNTEDVAAPVEDQSSDDETGDVVLPSEQTESDL
ncbi:MAG: hypothetical protein IJ695_01660 [Butyrivibrio sp.]|nr:hypothetical protein [Butyrivibrio sp.]